MKISSSHPALAGHFPGHPVVPGALLMSYVLAEIRLSHHVLGIKKIKFFGVILPDVDFALAVDETTAKFTVTNNEGQVLVSGGLLLERK